MSNQVIRSCLQDKINYTTLGKGHYCRTPLTVKNDTSNGFTQTVDYSFSVEKWHFHIFFIITIKIAVSPTHYLNNMKSRNDWLKKYLEINWAGRFMMIKWVGRCVCLCVCVCVCVCVRVCVCVWCGGGFLHQRLFKRCWLWIVPLRIISISHGSSWASDVDMDPVCLLQLDVCGGSSDRTVSLLVLYKQIIMACDWMNINLG